MQRRHVNTGNVSHRADAAFQALPLGGDWQRRPGRRWELLSTSQLHLQQLLVRLADSAGWICARFIFIRCPSVLPASNIDETQTETAV